MKNVIKKCLVPVLAFLLMLLYMVPVFGAAEPDFAKRQSNVYDGERYIYTIENIPQGGSVKWSVEDAGKSYLKLSKTTGTTVKITINTSGKTAAKNAVSEVTAKIYDRSKKLVKTITDKVWVRISASEISISPPKNVDTSSLELGTNYRFTPKLTPSNSTSRTYYTVQNTDGTATNDASVDSKGNVKIYNPGTYKLIAEAKDTGEIHDEDEESDDKTDVETDDETEKTLASASLIITAPYKLGNPHIELRGGGSVPAGIYVGDTLSLVLVEEIQKGLSAKTKVLTDRERKDLSSVV